MVKLKAGDRVRIKHTEMAAPWKGPLTGTILLVHKDGTIAVEVKDGGGKGHNCGSAGTLTDTDNGWWFLPEELTVIRSKRKENQHG